MNSINTVSPGNDTSRPGSSFYLFGICFITTLGGFLFGYDTAIISGCNVFLESHFELTKNGLGWAASSALLGAIFGTMFAGYVADRAGRKPALIMASLCLVISATGSMLPPTFLSSPESFPWFSSGRASAFGFLIIARLIGGVGVGITYAISPLYIAEITLPKIRGMMVSVYQLSITMGILLAFLVDFLILRAAGDDAGIISAQASGSFWHWAFKAEIWRGMFGTEIPIALAFFLLLFLAPESPRWLIGQGRKENAMRILTRIGGENQARKEMAELDKVLQQEEGKFTELFHPYLRIPLMIGILLPIFSHLSGIAAIMYYAPNILNESMQSSESSFMGAVLVGLVNMLFTFVAIRKIDKFGRRKLLLTGVLGVFISLACVGILFLLGSKWVIIPLLIYVACFAFSYGPVVWTVIGEIFPTRIRGRAAALGAFSLSVTSFLITQTNPVLFEKISPAGTFFLYAGFTVPAIWFIWKYVPETKGRTLEEIEQTWLSKKTEKEF
ncbi:D-xylose transporter [Anaerohalosphaera lusitana]|uniref:D-xylose transporter n=1 Tax=Anaerohalosphaera lusitana TaxID=1936003 RepID=A0A1U9NMM1_9BACT|nr:sugar porter family MFS transporter [Anaerohalosphaera lusitana]AQT68756.1 D-xylose transporter [Anaerohalosphaera lusitana]